MAGEYIGILGVTYSGPVVPPPPIVVTPPSYIPPPLLIPKYHVVLRDWTGKKVAMFDNWATLEYTHTINDVGSHTFVYTGWDARLDLFTLDSILEIHRSVVAVGLNDYVAWRGFHRTPSKDTDNQGTYKFTSSGVGLNSLLARPRIGYKGGTAMADKSIAAETAMKEYVNENCGALATVANGRELANVMLYLTIAPGIGSGAVWSGSKPFESLLDVLKEISQFSKMDFAINYTGGEYGPPGFEFQAYPDQLGDDHTDVGLNTHTGLNAAGFFPVIFSIEQGNVISAAYTYERTQESNVIYVLGDGSGSTQQVVTRTDPTKDDSPWNQWETSRPQTGYDYQLSDYGDASLIELRAMEKFEFTPAVTGNCVYGYHFKLGDKVVVIQKGVKRYKRLTSVKTTVADSHESLEFTFADVPYGR